MLFFQLNKYARVFVICSNPHLKDVEQGECCYFVFQYQHQKTSYDVPAFLCPVWFSLSCVVTHQQHRHYFGQFYTGRHFVYKKEEEEADVEELPLYLALHCNTIKVLIILAISIIINIRGAGQKQGNGIGTRDGDETNPGIRFSIPIRKNHRHLPRIVFYSIVIIANPPPSSFSSMSSKSSPHHPTTLECCCGNRWWRWWWESSSAIRILSEPSILGPVFSSSGNWRYANSFALLKWRTEINRGIFLGEL